MTENLESKSKKDWKVWVPIMGIPRLAECWNYNSGAGKNMAAFCGAALYQGATTMTILLGFEKLYEFVAEHLTI